MHNEHDEEEYEGEEIDLDSIEDEQTLIELLDETEDVDERKRIRDRLRKVQFEIKAQREKDRRRREDEREAAIRNRLKEADEKKRKTLQMYSEMAKEGGPPGSKDPRLTKHIPNAELEKVAETGDVIENNRRAAACLSAKRLQDSWRDAFTLTTLFSVVESIYHISVQCI
ncbi:uncharacterized protein LOC129224870 [Uloborus diversus]|uniref:uncharacterized protein LOC129224870 n=1 Tax=Uloborus diversus TaxID=327109 RepID=UPI0024096B15|nr:uncharacterized protein LOC129224870 [Uloborus diversus]